MGCLYQGAYWMVDGSVGGGKVKGSSDSTVSSGRRRAGCDIRVPEQLSLGVSSTGFSWILLLQ